MNFEELTKAFMEKLELDLKFLDVEEKVEKNTRKIADAIDTSPEYLDRTANLIGRSIESMLGFNEETGMKDIVEELRIANDQRERLNEKNNIPDHASTS